MAATRQALLLDSNILLLLVVGGVDRSLITRYKRTGDRFDSSDYDLLVTFVSRYDTRLTTPHVLTEVSNLLTGLRDPQRRLARGILKSIIEEVTEEYFAARAVVGRIEYQLFGLTDAAIIKAAAKGVMVLTDDAVLAAALNGLSASVQNFNYLRDVNDA